MHEDTPVEIKVSRRIPAEKWRIIRLLTRVWEFPKYIPTIKEASVINKSGHTMRTKWKVQVDSIPISWVEEDRLELSNNVIYFHAIEGDLEEFRGEWAFFNDSPEGTEVIVKVSLKVGVPAIKEFANTYIQKLLTRNFETILEYLERRLISTKYASFKKGETNKVAGFGIVGHPYNFYHLERSLRMLNPNFKMPSREFLSQLFNISPSFKMFDVKDYRSKTGETVNGCCIMATFIPDMMEKDKWAIYSKVVRACKIAEKQGVGVVTLGGFASIVGERIGHEISSEVDVAVTTGNTFPSAMAIDGVLKAANLLGRDVSSLKAAVIGGTGDIGSACSRALTSMVKQLTITGRTKSNLALISKELAKRRKARIIATRDNQKAVKDADIVIAAASSTSSILETSWFKPGAIVCDVGYPKNISYAPNAREDVLIFSGGLAKTPMPFMLPIETGLPTHEVIYGCFAEAIILAFEKRYENFSFGRGNITEATINEIREMGKKHGFEVSDFYWGDKLIDEAALSRIKEAIANSR